MKKAVKFLEVYEDDNYGTCTVYWEVQTQKANKLCYELFNQLQPYYNVEQVAEANHIGIESLQGWELSVEFSPNGYDCEPTCMLGIVYSFDNGNSTGVLDWVDIPEEFVNQIYPNLVNESITKYELCK